MPYYNIIPFRPVLAAGLVLAVAVALVAAGPLLVLPLVTGTAASLAASRSAVSVVSPVGRPVTGRQSVASRSPVAGPRWPLVVSVGPSASLAAYVINTSVFLAERNARNGCPLHIGASRYIPTCPSAAFSRNFLFLFFYFGPRSPILDSWPFLGP